MAQTTYQLMNMVKFVYFNTEDSKGNSIIFINDKVESNLSDKSILTNSGLFQSVVVYNGKKYKEDRLLSKIDTALNVIDRNAFEKLVRDFDKSFEVDIVVIPTVSLESQIFWQYIKHRKVYLIEDGLGSLTGDILSDGMSSGRRRLTQLLYGSFEPDKMYLNNLNFNVSDSKTEFCEIPGRYDDELCAYLRNLFLPADYISSYRDDDIVYLQQPVAQWDSKYLELEKQLLYKCVDIINERMIIRCHPLTVNNPRISGIRYDLQNYSWETVCIDQISEHNILMGVFSTAQFSPKQIFDREPYVIFLHRIIKPTNLDQAEIEKMISKLKDNYNNKNRILVPDSEEALIDFLTQISASYKFADK